MIFALISSEHDYLDLYAIYDLMLHKLINKVLSIIVIESSSKIMFR